MQMATLPSQLKIGALTYTIERFDATQTQQDDGMEYDLFGDYDPATLTIRVSSGLPEARAAVTALHEMVHGVLEHAGFADQDEQTVSALAYGLLGVLRDNPAFVDYIINAR